MSNLVANPQQHLEPKSVNGLNGFVANVANFSRDLLKIGDRVKMGGDIITVEKIEGNIVCGRTDDDSYVGGSIDSVQSVSTDELPTTPIPTNGEIERVTLGNGMVQIVRQQPTEIIDGVEVEYEC